MDFDEEGNDDSEQDDEEGNDEDSRKMTGMIRLAHDQARIQRYVIDGGYLLRRVVWDKMSTYGEIIRKYQDYVRSRYGTSTVIFDGYEDGPSTKDHEHSRRLMGSTVAPNVTILKI